MTWDPLEEARAKLVALGLSELLALQESLHAELSARVAEYRRDGVTWKQIGQLLGCSAPEAHRRHYHAVKALLEASPEPPVLPGQSKAF